MRPQSFKQKIVVNVLVLLFSLHGMSQTDFRKNSTSAFEKVLMDIFTPIQKLVTFTQTSLKDSIDHYFLIVNTSKENETLNKKVTVLENMLFKFKELERENLRLKDLLKFGQEIPREKVLAQVVAWDAVSTRKVLRINKGEADGVSLNSTVVTSDGVVGYIYQTSKNYSDIITVLDQNNRIDAIVSRTRSHGIVEGYNDTSCIMKYVTRTEPVVLNDEVITAGLGEIYPKGLRVGTISKIERESYGITQFVEITPSVNFGKLEEVIVLISTENTSVKSQNVKSEEI